MNFCLFLLCLNPDILIQHSLLVSLDIDITHNTDITANPQKASLISTCSLKKADNGLLNILHILQVTRLLISFELRHLL